MMNPSDFFTKPVAVTHKKYEVLRSFYVEGLTALEVAEKYDYTVSSVYALTRDFLRQLKSGSICAEDFFISKRPGRKQRENKEEVESVIIELRKKYLSVPDIKMVLDARSYKVSEKYIYNVTNRDGFARLPRRSGEERSLVFREVSIKAKKSRLLTFEEEKLGSEAGIGILNFIPYICHYEIDTLIKESSFPETKSIPLINSILCFLALKLSNFNRYTQDEMWCMDRGLGLFAGLNVLPKAAWYSSYSSRVSKKSNLSFLRVLHKRWSELGLLSDTANLDFVSIPYWGDGDHLENNWSGTRHIALPSVLAAVAQDPDSGIITYGDTTVRHENHNSVVIEFLDFYRENDSSLKYLVFDSKFTSYENLRKLEENNVKFITIRRRGSKIVKELAELKPDKWKTRRVPLANGKSRIVKVFESRVTLKGYDKELRQIAITGNGRVKPALIVTNDFDIPQVDVLRKYARRWLVEKGISDQTHFFHLNKISSSMVIKVDFDLTMSILAYNLYRLLAIDITGYSHCTPQSIFRKFIHNGGDIEIAPTNIQVRLKKKRNLPALLQAVNNYSCKPLWLNQAQLTFHGASRL